MQRVWPVLLAGVSGVVLALAFPKVDWNILAWGAFIPLLWMTQGQTLRRAFSLGWIAGMGFYLCTLYWVVDTIGLYSNVPHIIAVGPLLLMCAILSAYTGVFAVGLCVYHKKAETCPAFVDDGRTRFRFSRPRGSGWSLLVFGPMLWVALEWVRSFFLIGFPWVSLGYSQYNFVNLIQFVEYTGVYGLSALVIFGNVALFLAFSRQSRGRLVLVLLLVIAGLWGWGNWRRSQLAALPPVHTLHVGIAQGNIAQDQKWDPDYQEVTLARYEQLTRQITEHEVDLVIWPEAAVPFFFQSDVTYRGRLLDLAQNTNTPLLFGGPAFRVDDTELTLFNRAYLLSPDTTILGHYDKMILTPFGEYIPFQDSVLFFLDKWVEGIGDFAPGTTPTVFSLPLKSQPVLHPDDKAGHVDAFETFGVLVCYEGVFPDLARRFVHNGAGLLINVTNDAWFGETSAPHQHLAMEAMRAVENRVPLVRSANTGISAIVNIDGQIQAQTALLETTFITDQITWPHVASFYTRYGDWFVTLCVAGTLVMLSYAGITVLFVKRTGGGGDAGRNQRKIT